MKKMNKKGFTLVEMLVVIAIIAILVSILIPTVLGATKKAKAATDAANLRSALAEFEIALLTDNVDFDTVPATGTDAATKGVSGFKSTNAGIWTQKVTASKSDSKLIYMVIAKNSDGDVTIAYAANNGTGDVYTVDYFSTVAEGKTGTVMTIKDSKIAAKAS